MNTSAPAAVPRAERGYTLAALLVAVTVLNIMLAMALPVWSKMIQREKEEELISRGLQYAQAIQVFQTRYSRLPIQLDELIKVKPRCIRQLWDDPMTEDGKWGLIFQTGPGGQATAGDPNAPTGRNGRQRGVLAQGTSPGLERGGTNDEVTLGPISGVFSRSTEDSILTFANAQQHSEWKFDTQLLASAATVSVEGGAPIGTAVMPARWIGRPFRKGITVQMQQPNQPLAQGTGPGGAPGQPGQVGQAGQAGQAGSPGLGQGNPQQEKSPFGVGGNRSGQRPPANNRPRRGDGRDDGPR